MNLVVGEDLLMYKVDFLDGLFGILGNQFPETMWEYRSIYVTLTWERKTPFSIGFYTPNGYFMCKVVNSREVREVQEGATCYCAKKLSKWG